MASEHDRAKRLTRTTSGRLCLSALIAATLVARVASAHASTHLTDSLYNLVAAPTAQFVWFPALPHVDQRVTLVSTSTDLASPITAYGWDLTDFGVFTAAGPATTTTFTTPASHLVRLRVTAADGLSSVAVETIHMSASAANVMNPFPVVRIVGTDFAYGTKIRLLAVEAPAGARINVACRGRGCPRGAVRRTVPARVRGIVRIAFPRFERLLSPGASLKVLVSRGTEIGAYTHVTIRRHRLPARVDSCLQPAGSKPIPCPS